MRWRVTGLCCWSTTNLRCSTWRGRFCDAAATTSSRPTAGGPGVREFAAQAAQFRAVVLDLRMPDIGGDKVFDEIRSLRPETPVVISSGYDLDDMMQRFAGRKGVTFLRKPYLPSELIAALESVIPTDAKPAKLQT